MVLRSSALSEAYNGKIVRKRWIRIQRTYRGIDLRKRIELVILVDFMTFTKV